MRGWFRRLVGRGKGRPDLGTAVDAEIVALKAKGNQHFARQELADAERCYRDALRLAPGYAVARNNLAHVLLRMGRFEEGWQCFETRYDPAIKANQQSVPVPDLPFPQWRGEPLEGKSLLICPEQGFGDEIQFCRYVPQLKQRGAKRVSLICKTPLRPLFESLCGVDAVYPDEDGVQIPVHDYWSFPLSLPLHCGTRTVADVPAELPYLHASAEHIEAWKPRLPPGRLRVGLVWKGDQRHSNDANRSLPNLGVLAPLWQVAGVSFVSLQKGAGEDEARRAPPGQPLTHLGSDIADFADAAAVISCLDLVICVDTAIAHLAGALARPCWVLLPWTGTDWRWLHQRSDSPWYPNAMRLFRQSRAGDWSDAIVNVAQALTKFSPR